jgi:hypothetical protein
MNSAVIDSSNKQNHQYPRINDSICSTIYPDAEAAAAMAFLTRLEISVQSLHGVDLTPILSLQPDGVINQPGGSTPQNKNNSKNTPIICTVGFSGSSENMQIGSSRLCTDTGHLVIESDPWGPSKQSKKCSTFSSFRWTDPRPNPPHATVFLDAPPTSSSRKKQLSRHRSFTVPLTKINRDSKLVLRQTYKESKSKISPVKSPQSMTSSSPASSWTSQHRHSLDGGESLIWGCPKSDHDDDDDEAATLPEILEISIRVNEQPVGVAFFVFFGQNNPDDPGTYVLDLPVRKPATTSQSSTSTTKSSILTDQTKLRIQVTVTAPPPSGGIQKNLTNQKQHREEDDEDDPIPNLSFCSTASSSYSSPYHQLLYTRSMLEDQVDPLMQKLRQREREAMRFRLAQKRAMDIVVPDPNSHSNSNSLVMDEPLGTNHDSMNNNNSPQPTQPPRPPKQPFPNSSAFCQGIVWNWSQIRQTLEAAVYCGGNGSAAAIRFPKFMGDDASLDSSIATYESWDI